MTVRFTVPGSEALPHNRSDSVVWARHRQLGGRLGATWGAYSLGGDLFAWTIRHGKGVDPTLDVDALAGASLATVVLTPGTDYTSEDVANAIAAEIDSAFGHTVDVDSVTVDGQTRWRVSIASASDGLVGTPAANAGPSGVIGIHESRRDGVGAVNGTLFVHCRVRKLLRDGTEAPSGRRCRITGVGYYGQDGIRPRLAAGLGAYANPPSVTSVVDAGRPSAGPSIVYEPVVVPLPVAIPTTIGSTAWIMAKDDGTGAGTPGVAYRLNSNTDWFGDCVDGSEAPQQLLVDTGQNDPTVAFASTLSPGSVSSFGATSLLFLVVELDDADNDGSGFAGDGSIWAEYGCQRDAAGETPTEDEPAGEVFAYRFLRPALPRVAIAGCGYGLAAVDAAEDMSAAVYAWEDLLLAPSVAPRLIGTSGGRLGFDDGTPDTYNVGTFTRIPIGDDEGSEPYVSIGFNGGRIVGGAPTALQIQFDLVGNTGADFGADSQRLYNQGQSPDRLVSDFVVGGLRDLCEYVSVGATSMPIDAPAGTWIDPWDLAGSNSRPGNLGRAFAIVTEQSPTADVITVEDVADGASVSFGASLDLQASALAAFALGVAFGPGVDLSASGVVQVAASVTFGSGLNLRVGRAVGGSAHGRHLRRLRLGS